jgi:putative transposase
MRNEGLVERIREIKAAHPFWGYRRTWAHLRFIDKLPFNKKRVQRLMQVNGLAVGPNAKLKARRTESAKPRPTRPDEWWGIDMTKVLVGQIGWVYIVIVLDWYTKKVVGYQAGLRSKSADWLTALDMAVNQQFPDGARDKGVNLMSDNGCQPTSISFMKACSTLGVHQAFTSYGNPKGNADTERFMRTMKEECLWLREWTSYNELVKDLENWIEYYNGQYLHSALGYKPPRQFENEFNESHDTLLVAA